MLRRSGSFRVRFSKLLLITKHFSGSFCVVGGRPGGYPSDRVDAHKSHLSHPRSCRRPVQRLRGVMLRISPTARQKRNLQPYWPHFGALIVQEHSAQRGLAQPKEESTTENTEGTEILLRELCALCGETFFARREEEEIGEHRKGTNAASFERMRDEIAASALQRRITLAIPHRRVRIPSRRTLITFSQRPRFASSAAGPPPEGQEL